MWKEEEKEEVRRVKISTKERKKAERKDTYKGGESNY